MSFTTIVKVLRLPLILLYNLWLLFADFEGGKQCHLYDIAIIKISKILFAFSLITGRTEPLLNCGTKLFLPLYAWNFYLNILCSWFIYHLCMPHTVTFSTPAFLIFYPLMLPLSLLLKLKDGKELKLSEFVVVQQ